MTHFPIVFDSAGRTDGEKSFYVFLFFFIEMISESHIVNDWREVNGPDMTAAVRDVDFWLALYRGY